VKKWAKELNKDFSKEEFKWPKTHKEMQIKAMLRFHLSPIRMATVNNKNNKCWQGCGGK
jgi:hypothetical protein